MQRTQVQFQVKVENLKKEQMLREVKWFAPDHLAKWRNWKSFQFWLSSQPSLDPDSPSRFPALLWPNLNTWDTWSQTLATPSPAVVSGSALLLWDFCVRTRSLAPSVCFPLSSCSQRSSRLRADCSLGWCQWLSGCSEEERCPWPTEGSPATWPGRLRLSLSVVTKAKCWMVYWPAYRWLSKPCGIKYASARNQLNPPWTLRSWANVCSTCLWGSCP